MSQTATMIRDRGAPLPAAAGIPPAGRAGLALESLAAALWTLFLLLSPIATFRSGVPQPADYIAALVVALLLAGAMLSRSLRFPRSAVRPGRPLVVFVAYTFFISILWAAQLGRPELIAFPLFYFFNFCVLIGGLILLAHRGVRFLRTTAWVLALSVWVQALLPFVVTLPGHRGGIRTTLFFNNPNQLGYYAVLAAATCAVAYNNRLISLRVLVPTLASAGWLAMLSLSKASMLAFVVLLAFQLIRRPLLLAPLLLGVALGGEALQERVVQLPQVQRTITRLSTFGVQKDESLEGRGYDRIVEHPEYLVAGAAEGAYDRFTARTAGSELHSALGTLIFCYGIVGTLSLALFVLRTFQLVSFFDKLVLLPVIFYNVTHQGLRFTNLWIFFFFVLGVGSLRAARAAAARAEPRRAAAPPRVYRPSRAPAA